MLIQVYNRQKDLKISKGSAKALVQTLFHFLKITHKEIALYLVSEKKIGQIHDQFFQDPSPTDCISFPLDSDHLGEVFVCPSVAIQYAKKKNLDPYQETGLYIIHGILHLLGFDDLEPAKRRVMRKKEKICIQYLNKQKVNLSP